MKIFYCEFIIFFITFQGFDQSRPFYVTQTPMPHTQEDFWRLVTDFHISVLVTFELSDIQVSGSAVAVE